MQDNNKDFIWEREEGNEKTIYERKNKMQEGIRSRNLKMSHFKAPHLCIFKDLLDQKNIGTLQTSPSKLNLSDEMLQRCLCCVVSLRYCKSN